MMSGMANSSANEFEAYNAAEKDDDNGSEDNKKNSP